MSVPAIEIEGLDHFYRTGFRLKRVQILHGLSLTVQPGEIYGFIGPNGAGKTTTIKILMGLVRPEKGRVQLFGVDAREVASRVQVGFLPERPYFYEYLTALEFLDFYGRLYKLDARTRRTRAEVLLERVSLGTHGHTPLRRFSKGMLQRVGIAQALIGDPQLVVLDEPMSGLDPLGRMLMRDLILELRTQGRTVFFSSHILSDVELICDRVGILVGGRRKDEGTLEELLAGRLRFIELVARPGPTGIEALLAELRPVAQEVSVNRERVLARLKDADAQQEAVRRLFALGGELESLSPRRESLEDLFMDELTDVRRTGVGG